MKKITKPFVCFLFASAMLTSCGGGGTTTSPTSSSTSEKPKYTVNVIGGEGSAVVEAGSEITVKAYVETDDPFVNWTVDGKEVSKESEYKFTVEKDTNICANYEFGQYVQKIFKDSDKDFKILNLTDIQLHDGESTDVTFRVLDELITTEQPNMITFLGDMLNDSPTYDSRVNVPKVIEKIDSYNIPWAPIFGNHDFEDYGDPTKTKKTTKSAELASWYKNAKNCLYLDGPAMEGDDKNKGNYVVDIIDSSTQKPVESLIFADSRLAGVEDNFLPFYKKAVLHSSLYNGKTVVPSTFFTHVALPQYSDAFELSKKIEYRDMDGICGADPGKLTAGTENLFPLMKELGSTNLLICGHDHENSYATTYDGIKLAFSTKSSDGDNSGFASTVFPLGGSVVKLSSGKDKEFYYSKANNIFKITSSQGRAFNSDLVGFWQYSDAKLMFDVELPDSGEVKFSLQGTNVLNDVKDETYLGAWNRLSVVIKIDASAKTVDIGQLNQIEGNKYRYTAPLKDIVLNTGSGEVARGDETLRLIYFYGATADFTVSNLHYEFEEVTEKDQIDLSGAVISTIEEQTLERRSAKGATGFIPAKPIPTVTLNGEELNFGKDFYIEYENNTSEGEATLTIIPSGVGAHKYKGSNSITFNVVEGMRGGSFAAGVDKTLDFSKAYQIASDTLIFDVFFTSAANTKIHFMICENGTKWKNKFGYFDLNQDGTLGSDKKGYNGLSVKKLEDGYYRVTCVLKDITKYDEAKPTTTVDFLYIWGKNSTASGYIQIEPAE